MEPLEIECRAARTVAGQARMQAGLRMADWGLGGRQYDDLRADVLLTLAELVANAVTATPDGPIRIRLIPEESVILLGVWDASDAMPKLVPTYEPTLDDLDLTPDNFDDNGGWGLPLVLALAAETGTTPTHPTGKWVWARFKTT